jgi:hypothetical protein
MKGSVSTPWRQVRGKEVYSINLNYKEKIAQLYTSAALTPEVNLGTHLNMKLRGLQSRAGCSPQEQNIFPLLGLEPQTVQPVP